MTEDDKQRTSNWDTFLRDHRITKADPNALGGKIYIPKTGRALPKSAIEDVIREFTGRKQKRS